MLGVQAEQVNEERSSVSWRQNAQCSQYSEVNTDLVLILTLTSWARGTRGRVYEYARSDACARELVLVLGLGLTAARRARVSGLVCGRRVRAKWGRE
jgi:hypothetical protein